MALVLGYYDKNNLGDEQYRTSITTLLQQSGVTGEVVFADPHTSPRVPAGTTVIVCGGGDIINDYFRDAMQRVVATFRGPVVALSVGVTYASTITSHYLDMFDHIVLRHVALTDDVAAVRGSKRVRSTLDAGFTLVPQRAQRFARARVGVFLARGAQDDYAMLVRALEPLRATHDIVAYHMNVSNEPHESDRAAAADAGLTSAPVLGVSEIMSHIGGLALAVCVRYHAHVFAVVQGVPLVSLAVRPKTVYLMQDCGLPYVESQCALVAEIATAMANLPARAAHSRAVAARARATLAMFRVPGIPRSVDGIAMWCARKWARSANADAVAAGALQMLLGSRHAPERYGFAQSIAAGDHNWLAHLTWIRDAQHPPLHRGLRFVQKHSEFGGVHRYGWEGCTRMLQAIAHPHGTLCDLYADATFGWRRAELVEDGVLPYTERWVGWLHHTASTFGENNLTAVFATSEWRASLPMCRGLFVMSTTLAVWVRAALAALGASAVPVTVVMHPTEMVQKTFNMHDWLQAPTLTQVGAWLRNPYSIYALALSWGDKQVLVGQRMESYTHPATWCMWDTRATPAPWQTGGGAGSCGASGTSGALDALAPRASAAAAIAADAADDNMTAADADAVDADADVEDASDSVGAMVPHATMLRYMSAWLHSRGVPEYIVVAAGDTPARSAQWSAIDEVTAADAMTATTENYGTVSAVGPLSNDDYDTLLSKTAVFLDFVDVSAANTVVECMVRNTPIMCNRLPALEEYLGASYPGFFDASGSLTPLESAGGVMSPLTMYAATTYLAARDKRTLRVETFVDAVAAATAHL